MGIPVVNSLYHMSNVLKALDQNEDVDVLEESSIKGGINIIKNNSVESSFL